MDFLKAVNIIRGDLEEAIGLLEQLSGMSGPDQAAVELARSRITSAENLLRILPLLIPQEESATPATTPPPATLQPPVAEAPVTEAPEAAAPAPEPAPATPPATTPQPPVAEVPVAEAPVTEAPASQPPAASVTRKEKDTARAILADRFPHGGTLGEKISTGRHDELSSSVIKGKPVTDIAEAIGINDRFYYIRELFSGDAAAYSDTIRRLNGAESLGEAMRILDESTVMGSDPVAQTAFVDVVRRKFRLNV